MPPIQTLTDVIIKSLIAFGEDDLHKALSQVDCSLSGQNDALDSLKERLNNEIAANMQQFAISEVRPKSLECDVVRYQNNKEKWVAFVGLLDSYPYEIFTGVLDDEDGIALPKTVTKGHIIKTVEPDGSKHYDFQFVNRRGYKTTIEGLSEKFNKEYWNYAKLISGVLRYRMPITNVIKLVSSLQLDSDNINTWKTGVERALKKYVPNAENDESYDADKNNPLPNSNI